MLDRTSRPLIVGHSSDPHVETVVEALSLRDIESVVLDASSLEQESFTVRPNYLEIGQVRIHAGGTGWVRRLAPDRWLHNIEGGSIEDVRKRAFLRLVGGICRLGGREWLTSIERLAGAEDKIAQLAIAESLGISIPRTIVSSDPEKIIRAIGPSILVKPISGGFFTVFGEPYGVFATEVSTEELRQIDLQAAPVIVQELIRARLHIRVVTVSDQAWAAALDASDWPLDWRASEAAHASWRPTQAPSVCGKALELASRLCIGYSSQDWLVGEDSEEWFLDLNPSGQWLFLPPEVAIPVTHGIAGFLERGC